MSKLPWPLHDNALFLYVSIANLWVAVAFDGPFLSVWDGLAFALAIVLQSIALCIILDLIQRSVRRHSEPVGGEP